MIKSMTGFGKAVGSYGAKKVTIEIRALNSKQLDMNVRMPGMYKEKELKLRSNVAKLVDRGKIDLMIFTESTGAEQNYTINQELVASYHKELKSLTEVIGENDHTDYLSVVMRMPEVFSSERPELTDEEWTAVTDIIDIAIGEFDKFRLSEGKVLEADFVQRIKKIVSLLEEVEPYEKERIGFVRERIEKNLAETTAEEKIDRNRLEQELIYYLEKLDITEEKVRLKNHCEYFLETLGGRKSQGKKLGFIGQEIGREINTLGSKANNADIQHIVVQMKDELEKIKEQVLNVL